MSLTSYLADKEQQALRDKFKSEFPRPDFDLKKEILAPPLTLNYGIIGTAFDYLLRFHLQFKNTTKCQDYLGWVASAGYSGLQLAFDFKKDELNKLNNRFKQSKQSHKLFLKNGKLTNDFLANALFLAKLDLYVRNKMIAQDLFIDNDLDIQDLRNLCNSINLTEFIASDICLLNPIFGKASEMVGGADADIIIDDTLIDIKVTKHLKLERDYLNQLLGYYTLALIGGINMVYEGTLIKYIPRL